MPILTSMFCQYLLPGKKRPIYFARFTLLDMGETVSDSVLDTKLPSI